MGGNPINSNPLRYNIIFCPIKRVHFKNSNGDFADFHGLRHTFITNLFLNGVDPKTAQTLARHSDISLTMNVYTHLNTQTQINAINALPSPGIMNLTPGKEDKTL